MDGAAFVSGPKDGEPVVVAVTGAAGQIGYALLPMILQGRMFGANQKVALRLLEIAPAMEAAEGVKMELHDGAFPLLHSVTVTTDPMVAFEGAEVALLVGAFPRKQGMERQDLLKKNAGIFKVQGEAIDKVAARSVKVVVVGNPANTNAMLVSHFAPSIPKSQITALTRLDHNRAVSMLASRLDVPLTDVENVAIWGNHSATQYPDVFNAVVKGRKTAADSDLVSDLGGSDWLRDDFIPCIQKRGAAIIAARKLSSAMSAASAICDHMRDWVCGSKGRVVSMAVFSNGSYGIKEGIVYSFPVICDDSGNYKIVEDFRVGEFSRKYMDLSAEELLAERTDALACI